MLGGGECSVKTLQPIAILTFYIMLEGYSAMIPQPIAILSSYGTLRRYNITLLQPIVISTAYSTLGTLQRKASTTNSYSSSLEHSWGNIAGSQYIFFKSLKHIGVIQHKPSKTNIPFNSQRNTLSNR